MKITFTKYKCSDATNANFVHRTPEYAGIDNDDEPNKTHFMLYLLYPNVSLYQPNVPVRYDENKYQLMKPTYSIVFILIEIYFTMGETYTVKYW